MLCITSLWLMYKPLNPLSLFHTPPLSLLYLCVYFCFIWFFRFYVWDHMAFVFLWLTSLSIIPSRSIHVATNGMLLCFLWQVIFHCVYICIYIYTHHIHFIYSSISGYLGCFHILAIVNNAAKNIGSTYIQGAVAAQVQEGWEELLHVQGQEGQPWGDTPRPR